MHTGRLLLLPADAQATLPRAELLAALAAAGLCAGPPSAGLNAPGAGLTDASMDARAIGPRFFDLIGFTGCAVNLSGGGPARPTVSVRIDGPHPHPVLRAGRNSRPPRCPHCARPLADWRAQVAHWTAAHLPLTCPACGTCRPGNDWHWRQQAGLGRLFIAIEEVFPGEGQPLPALRRLLADLGLGPWQHCYIQDPPLA
ncbi:MAG: hypothetical protein EA400_09540 [Chromatiaceae bacterium]|nr:MAG: hypothetical protein EA400_09540 [Chromatiaceae bacterium]